MDSATAPARSLWRCPKCGRCFANRNQSHSCGKYSVNAYLNGKSPGAIELFHRFSAMVADCGPFMYAPAGTRIGFQVRMIFSAITLRQSELHGHVVLARRLENPRFTKIESLSPGNHVHHFRIGQTSELDDEVMTWLREAYRVGC
ncbi:MAG TPA: DUF5655 domain-containing protein [Bryobacteraceae bacterium]|nr:DUF5655 domain-containing protein [Bryobacteraceae bacterium]